MGKVSSTVCVTQQPTSLSCFASSYLRRLRLQLYAMPFLDLLSKNLVDESVLLDDG